MDIMTRSVKPRRKLTTGKILNGGLLLAALLVLPTTAYFAAVTLPPPGPGGGGWTLTTYSEEHSDDFCESNGCLEWCNWEGDIVVPTGLLCCSDQSGNCMEDTRGRP